MPNIKVFDFNQWIQIVIGTLLLGGLLAILKMYGDVETIKIEKRQDTQVLLKLDSQSIMMSAKINELSQKIALLEQAVKILARTKGMEGMISLDNFGTPRLVNPSQSWVASDCEGKECLPPVPAPPPRPDSEPEPTSK